MKNSVHAALLLVLCFFTTAALWLLLQAEFLAIALVLVYVGAVMVLFLFVVMMLDVKVEPLREGFIRYLPVGLIVAVVMLVEMLGLMGVKAMTAVTAPPIRRGASNTAWLGQGVVHAIPAAVRDRRGDPDRRRDRRDHAHAAPSRRHEISESVEPGRGECARPRPHRQDGERSREYARSARRTTP